ncbi:MAG: hypothetical protein K0V04_27085, partial [Deltaproteobacteria bacterium]|nr:hypothetical protein [Deltaproteobacteria bacterium]
MTTHDTPPSGPGPDDVRTVLHRRHRPRARPDVRPRQEPRCPQPTGQHGLLRAVESAEARPRRDQDDDGGRNRGGGRHASGPSSADGEAGPTEADVFDRLGAPHPSTTLALAGQDLVSDVSTYRR